MNKPLLIKKILVIQTAFIGDAILATAVIEKLHSYHPDATIDILVRKGNEVLFTAHPFIKTVWVWDKRSRKILNLLHILLSIRKANYDCIINCQRFFSTGLLTVFGGAKHTIGFDKNPLSLLFSKRIHHTFGTMHEVERNQLLITHLTDTLPAKPKLYPSSGLQSPADKKYVTISPASVWFTKQYPSDKWIEMINLVPTDYDIVLLGGSTDRSLCDEIKKKSATPERMCVLAGRLGLLESAGIMKQAEMNYVNDSAPMHLASAVDAPVCAVYCSTVPAFGYGPLSTKSNIVEINYPLICRPCGIHGKPACPEGHFKCANDIKPSQLIDLLTQTGIQGISLTKN